MSTRTRPDHAWLLATLLLCFVCSAARAQLPVLTERQLLLPLDPAPSLHFGVDVAIAGDVAAVGANGDADLGFASGAVYVFDRGPGGWMATQKLLASDGGDLGGLGRSVTIDGERLATGAIGGSDLLGAVYVFDRADSEWLETQKLMASDADPGDLLGADVALAGDRIVVGAAGDDEAGSNAGAAYVFEWDGTVWVEAQKLTASDALPNRFFGAIVAQSGDRIAICSPIGHPPNDNGAVYVFALSGGVWIEEAKITEPLPITVDTCLGNGLVFDGDTIAIGAPCAGPGIVFVFQDGPGGWLLSDQLSPSDGVGDDCFGHSLSLAGGRLAVGAIDVTVGGGPQVGAVYIYDLQSGDWVERARLMASDGEPDTEFAGSVATDGAELLVGALVHDGTGPVGSGAVFAYTVRDFSRGDVNTDGTVDISDVISLLGWLFVPGSVPAACDDSADINDDGQIDLADGIHGLSSLFVSGTPGIPVPANCDFDLTSDSLGCDAFDACP